MSGPDLPHATFAEQRTQLDGVRDLKSGMRFMGFRRSDRRPRCNYRAARDKGTDVAHRGTILRDAFSYARTLVSGVQERRVHSYQENAPSPASSIAARAASPELSSGAGRELTLYVRSLIRVSSTIPPVSGKLSPPPRSGVRASHSQGA